MNIDSAYIKKPFNDQNDSPQEFIAAGICCFIISLFDNLGLIDKILNNGFLTKEDLNTYPNRLVLTSALITLEKNGIISIARNNYFLTSFGNKVLDNRGSIGLIYGGYRHILANQMKFALCEPTLINENIDWELVANASIHFGGKTIDPIVIDFIKSLNVKGLVCDLGCGAATRLKKICELTNSKGVGIELSKDAVQIANNNLSNNSDIQIKQGNITEINDIFEEVELLMQFFVMHDITPTEKCLSILNSYLKNFPNLKYFLYCDIVAPSNQLNTQLPGCDYIHSLIGISLRTYEETTQMFESSGFEVAKEIRIPDLPNTILWILKPSV